MILTELLHILPSYPSYLYFINSVPLWHCIYSGTINFHRVWSRLFFLFPPSVLFAVAVARTCIGIRVVILGRHDDSDPLSSRNRLLSRNSPVDGRRGQGTRVAVACFVATRVAE